MTDRGKSPRGRSFVTGASIAPAAGAPPEAGVGAPLAPLAAVAFADFVPAAFVGFAGFAGFAFFAVFAFFALDCLVTRGCTGPRGTSIHA